MKTKMMMLGIVVAVGSCLSGCMRITYGQLPRVDALNRLVAGETTSAELLMELGEPRGRGVYHFNPDQEPRELWQYEYITAQSSITNTNIDLSMLWILIKEDRYDGHLFFDAEEKIRSH